MYALSLSTGMALAFGALHVLEPGHGKTALVAYMLSKKRAWRDGVIISLSSAATHTFTIFMIALAAHVFMYHSSLEDQIQHIGRMLNYVSGLLIICIGVWFVILRSKRKSSHGSCGCSHHKHSSQDVTNTTLAESKKIC